MRVSKLRVAGFRAFNDEQTVELDGNLVIYWGANGTGKTSIGESLEWLLYGKTLKRSKGDDISKREYAESYRNAHYTSQGRPFVEAEVLDHAGQCRTIRRELKDDEKSVLTLDSQAVSDLSALGITTSYDRPLILQHTLQDFIFMKPKTRYEVLSSMLGLDGLIAFRNSIEQAKSELPKRLPAAVLDAQTRSATLKRSMQTEPLLAPVIAAITRGNLDAAREQLVAIALGRVVPGTSESELIPALQAAQAAKERAQLDWGRLSLGPVMAPGEHRAITDIDGLEQRLARFYEVLAQATTDSSEVQLADARHQEFIRAGLELRDPAHPTRCPFCLEETLTPERLSELQEELSSSPEGQSALQNALAVLRGFQSALMAHQANIAALMPALPSEAEVGKVRELGAGASQHVEAYLLSIGKLAEQAEQLKGAKESLETTTQRLLSSLQGLKPVHGAVDARPFLNAYASHTRLLPALANAYAATYATLDPFIRKGLGSAAEARLLKLLIVVLEQWDDLETSYRAEAVAKFLQDLIRQTRQFIEKKQTEILGVRDKEIKRWYDLMNPSADVGYHQMVPGSDSLELQARSFSKVIMAAPNLSACQLNCLGLAIYFACATRQGSPHQMLLIDDPIQSMDDDHTETFKITVLKELLDHGFQVILLTHMDNFADAVEKLYRSSAHAVLYRFEGYTKSGPSIVSTGPEITRLLGDARKNKDATTEAFRTKSNLDLRKFVERFVKDVYTADTGKSVSKTYEDKSWGDLRKLLRQCKRFDVADEPILEGTYDFTSKYLHTGASAPSKAPSAAHLNPHYSSMKTLLDKYKSLLGLT